MDTDVAQSLGALELDEEDITHLIKAKGALDAASVLVKTTENLDGSLVCDFMFSPRL